MNSIFNLFGMIDNYPSREESEYNETNKSEPFKLLNIEEILNFKSEFCSIDTLYIYMKYQDPLDSANRKPMNFTESKYYKGIKKNRIIKHEKKESLEVIIYTRDEFESFENGFYGYYSQSGIWIAISKNSNDNWKYYYTGMVQNKPLYLKWFSAIPLIQNDSTIQIEASFMREIAPFTHSCHALHEVVKDGVYVKFHIPTITLDSDNDGLTDIVENKLFTDKFNSDTDNDGITDNLDMNPRKNLKRTEKTLFYEDVINKQFTKNSSCIPLLNVSNVPKSIVTDTTETIMIVTDNPDLMAVQPKIQRIIFLTNEEFKQSNNLFKTELYEVRFSPLFKVGIEQNGYKIQVSSDTWVKVYLLTLSEDYLFYKVIDSQVY